MSHSEHKGVGEGHVFFFFLKLTDVVSLWSTPSEGELKYADGVVRLQSGGNSKGWEDD